MLFETNKSPNAFNPFHPFAQDIERYLDTVFNNAGDPIYVADDALRFLLVNDAFCEVFGFSRDELIGKTLEHCLPHNEMTPFIEIDKQVLKDGKEVLVEDLLTIKELPTKVMQSRKTRFVDAQGDYFIIGKFIKFKDCFVLHF